MRMQIIEHRNLFEPRRYFKQCHASNLCLLPDGELMAVWFAGTRESNPDCAIWGIRTENGVWQEPERIADRKAVPCWNPVLLYNGEKLLLFFKAGMKIPEWQTWISESEDCGRTWSAPHELIPGDTGGRGPVKNKCIRLADGRILAPASVETPEAWNCFADYSDDNGTSWQKSGTVPLDRTGIKGKGIIQPTLWQRKDGSIGMLMRSSEGCIMKSESSDGGKTWTAARRTAMPNNNCGIDAVCMPDGRMFLVCNPVGENWGRRSPIALFASDDDSGENWGEPLILEHVFCEQNEPSAEFSYPSVIADGTDILITYTWKRESIAFWRLRPAE